MIVYGDRDGSGAELGGNRGEYRWSLWRRWWSTPPLVFVMLNPSTADASKDDPTIRRCLSFATREGRGGLLVVNLFAFRTKDPDILDGALGLGENVIGDRNDGAIAAALEISGVAVVAAWGRPTRRHLREAAGIRGEKIAAAARARGVTLQCLGMTNDGWPRHPLYLRADSPLTTWPGGR